MQILGRGVSDEKNYPIDFHCIAGADRTGALAAALEALLGVSERDIVIDYTLTSLSSSGMRRPESCIRQLRAFDKYPGATLNERVEARPSKGRKCFTDWNYFTKDSKLVPSGLVGPLELLRRNVVN